MGNNPLYLSAKSAKILKIVYTYCIEQNEKNF